ncbi:ADP-glyceromanno-heptose 6-epimerase [Desulfohalobium retbaense]|uniref:ADP-L-glycero-D-manno-heptose-6-epimerase n=1 Tax=Desulfohalobium retbaense (strain ATCC 49708 / DSM 5692 / JCM 16813 / HR100) TaxID=485915 RepID=C8X251_DESRD|nr:ADP-glyceromanno-heptose 6-epimerase [Desulfohalobium retbaense]ACV68374.1 ADP-L-glycero-D-manno-heptose-6-epimerase [Desulfohalobium retbaense DSM 5692]
MIVVTGGAGFIGSAFVWQLNQMGIRDILVVDNLACSEKWKNLVNLDYQDYLHRDAYLEKVRMDRLPAPRAIIHMGACSSTTERDADFLMENNYRYSKILAEYAMKHGARFIYASSAATYGDGQLGFDDDLRLAPQLKPLNMYGYSKQLFDLWVMRNGLLDRLCGLKFFNVFGPNEYHKQDMRSVVCKAFNQVHDHGRIRLFKSYHPEYEHGEQHRDFVYVKDCVAVMAWLLDHPGVNGIYNVGTGTSRTWNDLARAVFMAMGQSERIEYMEMPESLQAKYQYYTQARMERLARAGCPVRMRSLEDGVADYIAHLQASDPYLEPETRAGAAE